MAAKTSEEQSERKRVSIPKVDQSVLEWWDLQHDVGLSIRMLVRAEIERNGYVDTAYQPVAQQPKRGRPAASATDDEEPQEQPAQPAPAPVALVQPVPAPTPVPAAAPAGVSAIDAIMNG